MKIWSLPNHENLTKGKKILWKRGEIAPSFPQYFQYISNSKSPFTYIFVKSGCSNYFFFNSANLICRGTDISKYFIVSLGLRDNVSRLYTRLKQSPKKVVLSFDYEFFFWGRGISIERRMSCNGQIIFLTCFCLFSDRQQTSTLIHTDSARMFIQPRIKVDATWRRIDV